MNPYDVFCYYEQVMRDDTEMILRECARIEYELSMDCESDDE